VIVSSEPEGVIHDGPREACGVFGIYAPGKKVSHLTYDGIFALQHRGQESAGMAVSDGRTVTVVKDMGLVAAVFDERTLAPLTGHIAIGHTRYSTTGSSEWSNAQPVYRPVGDAGFALGHNGNLTNTAVLAKAAGLKPGDAECASDSALVAELIARRQETILDSLKSFSSRQPERRRPENTFERAIRDILPMLEGAFSLVLMDAQRIVAVRDPNGFRPLALGKLDRGWVVASETPALEVVGAHVVRELEPGELVVIDAGGVRSVRPFGPDRVDPKLCVFEFVYFARPDSVLYGKEVNSARQRMGELLAQQAPVAADLVMGVPDSGVPAAEGYARASRIAFGHGLVKNRYLARTFISPHPDGRALAVRRKLNPLRETIAGKRLVVVDDSIVRGTTTREIVKLLREAGAREVHLRISSPPYRWPCFYGMDTGTRAELLAADLSIGEIVDFLGVDSLAYLMIDNLIEAVGAPGAGFCTACLTGVYPTAIPGDADVEIDDAGRARPKPGSAPRVVVPVADTSENS
jgi:amidophosphoribosyltransferase